MAAYNSQTKWDNIFNLDFFPTPRHVLDMMQIDANNEIILEPSAGKGNIIDYVKERGAKDVLFCEINNDLAHICKAKARFIESDFLSVNAEQISHVTQIIMNPPFSKAKEHILHAWEIATDGCVITTLCNSDTFDRWRGGGNNTIEHLVKTYGYYFDLGNCFAQGERLSEVKVSCIKLYKPCSSDSIKFEGFYMDAEPDIEGSDGIIKYNEVQALVNSYMGAIKCFDDFEVINDKMKRLCEPVGMNEGFAYNINYGKTVTTKVDFSKELQKRSWSFIFSKMNLSKYLTSGVMRDVNNFVEQQQNVPFTVKNIYKMFEIIVGTKDEILNRALVEVVDNFTQHTHENRYGVEGWKTNAGHLLNKKIIVDYAFECKDYGRKKGNLDLRYGSTRDRLQDLVKVLCNLTGTNYENTTELRNFCDQWQDGLIAGRWYCWSFFEFKGFKKGTMHLKFTDNKVWEMLNRQYAKIKGSVLPEKI